MSNNFIKTIGIVAIVTVVAKVLGFVREAFVAAYFGTSSATDAFFVANIVPNILFTALGLAIASGIIPLYAEQKEKSEAGAKKFVSAVTSILLLFSILVVILGMIFAPQIAKLMAPGFNKEQLELATELTRIMIPAFSFMIMSAIATGVLHTNKQFLAPAMVSIPNSVIVIFAMILFGQTYGVVGLTVASLLGIISQFIIQLPQFSQHGIRLNFAFNEQGDEIKRTFYAFMPIIIASLAVQLNAVVDRMVASGLDEGSISALNYANKLMYLPLSIIIAALIDIFYPTLVDNAKKGDAFLNTVRSGMKTIFYFSVPILIVMLISREELVAIAFQRGEFQEDSLNKTVNAFVFYTIGMVFIALREYFIRCFFALKKTKVTMYTSIIAVLINIILSIILSKYLALGGIALASSISFFLQAVILYVWLNKDLKKENKLAVKELLKVVVLTSLTFIVPSILVDIASITQDLIQIILVTIVTYLTFIGLGILLRINEFQYFINKILKRT
ncbi:murein biosynthesis integral membrane protein MurJ [Sutcliffiella sp. NPDC057660]|uniref:murein biosynthesis integral membrane protein MurJ n=1 Tax=Sutcliffiella sp. NPDC057660 TaxID=3346199 RepID=UPI003675C670